MAPVLQIAFEFLVAVAVGVGYVLLSRPRNPVAPPSPPHGAVTRLRMAGAVYRCRFEEVQGQEWVFTAPLQRDVHVPIAVGEDVIAETVMGDGVALYRTRIAGRDSLSHTISLVRPVNLQVRNRRVERRHYEESEAVVDGHKATVLDFSRMGARVRCSGRFKSGTPVTLRWEHDVEPRTGWVLETTGAEMRLRLEG